MARLIRLIRIVKLYKAVYEAKRSSRNRILKHAHKKMEKAEWMDETAMEDNESRLGKKLSDLTIRRVIILVLSMLIMLPMLSPEASMKFPASPSYGADEVWISFQGMEDSDSEEARLRYETTLLRYVHFHNWFSGNRGCPKDENCPGMYTSHLWFVSVAGKNGTQVEKMVEKAKIRRETATAWVASLSEQEDIYKYGSIPAEVLSAFSGPWTDCSGEGSDYVRLGFSLIEGEVPSIRCPTQLRKEERRVFAPRKQSLGQFRELTFAFHFDQRPYVRTEAISSLMTTFFVCLVLCISALMFYNDVNQLVLFPVEKMIAMVEAIRDNPLMAIQLAEQDFARELKTDQKRSRSSKVSRGRRPSFYHTPASGAGPQGILASYTPSPIPWYQLEGLGSSGSLQSLASAWKQRCKECCKRAKRVIMCTGDPSDEEVLETVILEKTIIKLGSLLALGFGEAGAHIINTNLVGSSSSGVNVMVPGRKVDCVIGQARIQDFSIATEVLQSKVMTFVNQVAEIVHGVVNELHGAANKNNGSTFLLIWRCGGDRRQDEEHISPTKLADMSVLAFAKIIGAVHASPVLANYRGHPGLQQRLGSEYRVEVKCGLHFGWAIEGAVGSEFKIDASYLSPNVSVAASLEEATKYYSVCFLASEAVVQLCSPHMASKCRNIDRVRVPGSKDALELYSIDLDWQAVEIDTRGRARTAWSAQARMMARQKVEAAKKQAANVETDIEELFHEDPLIDVMRLGCTQEFQEIFRMGYENYAQGEWQVARRFLEQTRELQRDGPSRFLVGLMESWQFEAPPDWQGTHDLGPISGIPGASPSYATGVLQTYSMM